MYGDSVMLRGLLYDRTSVKSCVDDARMQLFVKKGRQFDTIHRPEQLY